MKFSDAISSIWPRWRSSSGRAARRSAGRAPRSTRGRSCSSVSWATAIALLPVGTADATRRSGGGPAARASASSAGTAPSRSTLGSGPVKSRTVDGVPGAPRRRRMRRSAAPDRLGTSSSRLGSGPPGRFALVATTAPTSATTARAGSGRTGTRTPIVSGRSPVSQRKRRAGFGRTSVYGPGSSAAHDRRSPRSSGTHSKQHLEARCRRARSAAPHARPFSR